MAAEGEDIPFTQVDKLVQAVQYGDYAFIETALSVHRVSPDTKDTQKCSLLHWAAINNRIQIATLLLAHHANVNIVGGDGEEIPLQWAARYAQCLPMLSLLIQEGSNVRHRSVGGYDAVYLAVMAGHVHNAFVLLGAGGGDPNTIAVDGNTPLHWIIKHRNFEKDNDAIEMVRQLVAFGADVRIGDALGDTPLMCLATSSRTRRFPEDIAFLLHQAGQTPSHKGQPSMIFGVTNHENDSAWVITWKTQNLHMLRVLWDLTQYNSFAHSAPIIVRVALMVSFFFALQSMGYVSGLCLWLLLFCLSLFVDQGSLSSIDSSRSSCGTAWGIIIMAAVSYQWYMARFFSTAAHAAHWCLLGAIGVALWRCMQTPPVCARSMACRHLRVPTPFSWSPSASPIDGDAAEGVSEADRREYWTRLLPRIVQAPPLTNSRKETVGSSFRFCSTCLIEKPSNTVHCRSCNVCVVGLDHHCPFVNNCVGRGNRRLFVWFTIVAAFGCGLMAVWSLYLQTTQLCPHARLLDHHHHFLALMASEWCVFVTRRAEYAALGGITWVTLISAVLIGSLAYSQSAMVMRETTTFESMRRQNEGHSEACCGPRSWKNLQIFALTGQFRVADGAPSTASDAPPAAASATVAPTTRVADTALDAEERGLVGPVANGAVDELKGLDTICAMNRLPEMRWEDAVAAVRRWAAILWRGSRELVETLACEKGSIGSFDE